MTAKTLTSAKTTPSATRAGNLFTDPQFLAEYIQACTKDKERIENKFLWNNH